MQSKATTVQQYLAELPPERRAAIQSVRDVILRNLDKGYEEGMSYGMIGYYVPHRLYPPGYHCNPAQPLPFAGLASQKNYMSLYIMVLEAGAEACDPANPPPVAAWFHQAWAKAGKKLDMGKCCIRFRTLDDLALDVVGEAIRRIPAKAYIVQYEAARAAQAARPPRSRKQAATKPSSSRSTKKAAKKSAHPSPAKRRSKKTATKKTSRK